MMVQVATAVQAGEKGVTLFPEGMVPTQKEEGAVKTEDSAFDYDILRLLSVERTDTSVSV